ncbi:hypothetical protein HRbin36_01818 [bacterium HR36]|nr:hypothetical protein HRbin36_01818 [bacterium HR36]
MHEILRPQGHFAFRHIQTELAVHAEAAHLAQAVACGIKETFVEQLHRLVQLRRIPRAHPLVNAQQGFLVCFGLVLAQGVEDEVILDCAEHLYLFQGTEDNLVDVFGRQFRARLHKNLTGFRVNHIAHYQPTYQLVRRLWCDLDFLRGIESAQDIGIGRVLGRHCTQQRGYGELTGLVNAHR